MSKRPAVNMSASFINSYIYYKGVVDRAYDDFLKKVNKEFNTNHWLERGIAFEQSIEKGEQGQLSELIVPLEKNGWMPNKYINFSDFDVKLNGKFDARDKDNGIIYDIKRVDKFDPKNFTDEYTVQHTIYFYLDPSIKKFYYLIASGVGEEIEDINVVEIDRPSEEEITNRLGGIIGELFQFLAQNNLWELFFNKHQAK